MSPETTPSTRLVVRVTPRGGADRIEGVTDAGEVLVRVAAAPVDGAANRSVVRLLAKELGVPDSAVFLEAGVGSRTKRVRVGGVAPDEIAARWPGASAKSVDSVARPARGGARRT